MQGSKKVPSGRPGQVDLPDGQVTFFILTCQMGKKSEKLSPS